MGGARQGQVRVDRDGFIGGGPDGYNGQFSPSWVFGIEADISYVDARRTVDVVTASLPTAVPPNVPLSNTFHSRIEYFGTVRGRLGYADRTMVYATGGLAYPEIDNSAAFVGPVGSLLVVAAVLHAFAPNWSVKAEYLYYDLGSTTVNVAFVPRGGGCSPPATINDGHIVRAWLNYEFGGGGSVVNERGRSPGRAGGFFYAKSAAFAACCHVAGSLICQP